MGKGEENNEGTNGEALELPRERVYSSGVVGERLRRWNRMGRIQGL